MGLTLVLSVNQLDGPDIRIYNVLREEKQIGTLKIDTIGFDDLVWIEWFDLTEKATPSEIRSLEKPLQELYPESSGIYMERVTGWYRGHKVYKWR